MPHNKPGRGERAKTNKRTAPKRKPPVKPLVRPARKRR